MSLHDDLLALAQRLIFLERTRPKQATPRRSVSTAYYALFHCLTRGAVDNLGPNLNAVAASKLMRWFDHREMKHVAAIFSSAVLGRPFALLLGAPPSADLALVAEAFLRLQGARHAADYDLSSSWTRRSALDFVQISRDAMSAWNRIRTTHEANVFALALLSPKLFDKDR